MTTQPAHPDFDGQDGPQQGSQPGQRPRPDSVEHRADVLINLILDAESEGQLHVARGMQAHGEKLFPDFAARMQRTREAVSRLTVLPECPDFTRAIIARVEDARRDELGAFAADQDAFGSPSNTEDSFDEWCRARAERRDSAFSATRLAMAAGVLGAIAFAVVLNRVAPVESPAPAGPVGEVLAASRADLQQTPRSLAGAIFSLGDGLVRPVPVSAPQAKVARGLALGDAGKYETSFGVSPVTADLASSQARVLAIIEGPIGPLTGAWDANALFPAVASPAAQWSSDIDGLPRVRAWRLQPSPASGSISVIRTAPAWASPAGTPAAPSEDIRN